MKITNCDMYKNQTIKYLLPFLKVYGANYIMHMNSLFKLGIGYYDNVFNTFTDYLLSTEFNLFFLVDSKKEPIKFNKTLQWLRTQPYYETDYAFDDVRTGNKHMFVITFPSQYKDKIPLFIEGKYSEMYKDVEINAFIKKQEIKDILLKNKDAEKLFLSNLEKEFDHKVNKWEEDYDFPPLNKNEIFNNHYVR